MTEVLHKQTNLFLLTPEYYLKQFYSKFFCSFVNWMSHSGRQREPDKLLEVLRPVTLPARGTEAERQALQL